MTIFSIITIILICLISVCLTIYNIIKNNHIEQIFTNIVGTTIVIFFIMFMISFFSSFYCNVTDNKITETTKIPIIVKNINEDDLSIIIKERNKIYILDVDDYLLVAKTDNYKIITDKRYNSDTMFGWMKRIPVSDKYVINIKEFKNIIEEN